VSIEIKAAVLVEANAPLELQTLTHEPLASGQVLVDVAYSGVCGSQLLEIKGLRGPDRFLPHLLGHEGSGIVAEVGDDVRKVKPGDRVVITWIAAGGVDAGGTTYTSINGQTVNSGQVSTFSNRAVVSENRLVPVDARLSLRQAALLGCCVPTGAGTVLNLAGVNAGDSVGIFGVGGVGLSAVLGAKMAGAGVIVAVDKNPANLELALSLGATHAVNTTEINVKDYCAENFSEGRFNATVEAAGHPEVMQLAIHLTQDKGTCVIAGNPKLGSTIEVNPFDLIKGKSIIGSWGGGTVSDRDIPRYAEGHLTREVDFSALIGSEYSLSRVNDAIAELERGTAGRVLLRTNSSISDEESKS
jgi:S-(hydroxymethyl)glutathione dehydrogenase / alcohol dehydrogenase